MITHTYRKTADIYPLHGIRAIDGDTIQATIVLPFNMRPERRIRLKGWWADELTGPYGLYGLSAKRALEGWLTGKVIWLHAPSCREDKYGRVVGHLLHEGKIVIPAEVLGCLQLTERVHNAHRAEAKASGGIRTADTKTSEPINDPRAFSGVRSDGTHDDDWNTPSLLPSPRASNPPPGEGLP